jgi:hypothetical protein
MTRDAIDQYSLPFHRESCPVSLCDTLECLLKRTSSNLFSATVTVPRPEARSRLVDVRLLIDRDTNQIGCKSIALHHGVTPSRSETHDIIRVALAVSSHSAKIASLSFQSRHCIPPCPYKRLNDRSSSSMDHGESITPLYGSIAVHPYIARHSHRSRATLNRALRCTPLWPDTKLFHSAILPTRTLLW